MGFSREEYWSGGPLPFSSMGRKLLSLKQVIEKLKKKTKLYNYKDECLFTLSLPVKS